MKRLVSYVAAAAMALSVWAMPLSTTAAFDPGWDLTGNFVFNFEYLGGHYAHEVHLTQDSFGALTGSGGYPAGGSLVYTWVLTSGSVAGNTFHFVADYTASADAVTPQTTMHVTGTINGDGTMQGTWTDNYQGGSRAATWATTSGAANITTVPDWGQQLSSARCEGKGKLVINVTQKVVNDFDSGMAGNNWALDSYSRHIKVWKVGSNTFCALVTYDGFAFATQGEIGPGGSGEIGENVVAEMKGGYRSKVFSGELKENPSWPLRGSIGEFDYQCDQSPLCLGRVSWLGQYFDSNTFDYDWWGWFYYGGEHGSWVNSSEGSYGNIL